MGNNHSDEQEKKVFKFVRPIPVVGLFYRVPRFIVYACKDNTEEVRQTLAVDVVEEINPVKKISNVARGISALDTPFEKGIWIGRRPLASDENFIGVSLAPGMDGYHWAVMCHGWIYQTGSGPGNKGKKGGSGRHNVHYTQSLSERCSFEWYLVKRNCPASTDSIKAWVDGDGFGNYNTLTNNCQYSTLSILRFASGWTEAKAIANIYFSVGCALA